MATQINAPLTSDIWHLSIDDLLSPMTDTPRLGGPGPFVINLSASSAPLSLPSVALATRPDMHAYQIQRIEDRRPRYRLRLGLFMTEDEADAMLTIVRNVYPGALTATADSEDMRALAALKTKAAPSAASATGTAPVRAIPAAAIPAAAIPAAAIPAAAIPVAPSSPPARPSIPVLSDSVEPIGRPLATPLVARPATAGVPPAAASPVVASPAAGAAHAAATTVAPVRPPAGTATAPQRSRITPPAARPGLAPASIESTQTLRALTTGELQRPAPRWYVIQLSLSREPFEPDALPNLDIFNEYRLYSVAGLDQGHVVHALRLGFFAEDGAAAAVASYLGAFYDKPSVRRISVAERERFRDQRVEARKDIGATGRHAVIEITGDMHVRAKRASIASILPLATPAGLAQAHQGRKRDR